MISVKGMCRNCLFIMTGIQPTQDSDINFVIIIIIIVVVKINTSDNKDK